jgi:hypothetical protein
MGFTPATDARGAFWPERCKADVWRSNGRGVEKSGQLGRAGATVAGQSSVGYVTVARLAAEVAAITGNYRDPRGVAD